MKKLTTATLLTFLGYCPGLLAFDPYLDGTSLPESPWITFLGGEPDQQGETIIVDFVDPVGGANNQALRLNSGTGANEWYIGAFSQEEAAAGARFRVVEASPTGKENLLCLTVRSKHLAPSPSITLVDGRFKLWSYVESDREIMDLGPVDLNVFHTVYLYARSDGLVKLWWDGKLTFDGYAPLVNPFDGYFEWGSGSWQFDATDTVDFDWVGFGTVADLPLAVTSAPAHGTLFQDASAGLRFDVISQPGLAAGVSSTNIAISLNGVDRTSELTITGTDTNRQVSFSGLVPDHAYRAVLTTTDLSGQASSFPIEFDTFRTNYFTFEAEDFNFDSGQFLPQITLSSAAGGDNYIDRVGVEGIDHRELSTEAGQEPHHYRADSLVATERNKDTVRAQYLAAQELDPEVDDFNVASVQPGEWLNYTRMFPAGRFQLYGRLAYGVLGTNFIASVGKVTNPTSAAQTVTQLGTFKGGPGRGWQTYDFVPLTDEAGNTVVIELSGQETLRVTAVDGAFNPNFYMLVPAPAAAPSLHISRSSNEILLSWEGSAAVLESTDRLGAAWTPVNSPTNPFRVTAGEGTRFFRLRP